MSSWGAKALLGNIHPFFGAKHIGRLKISSGLFYTQPWGPNPQDELIFLWSVSSQAGIFTTRPQNICVSGSSDIKLFFRRTPLP